MMMRGNWEVGTGQRRWLSDTLCEISGLLHDEAAAGQTPIIYIRNCLSLFSISGSCRQLVSDPNPNQVSNEVISMCPMLIVINHWRRRRGESEKSVFVCWLRLCYMTKCKRICRSCRLSNSQMFSKTTRQSKPHKRSINVQLILIWCSPGLDCVCVPIRLFTKQNPSHICVL